MEIKKKAYRNKHIEKVGPFLKTCLRFKWLILLFCIFAVFLFGAFFGSVVTASSIGPPSFVSNIVNSEKFIVTGIDAKQIALGIIAKNVVLPYHYIQGMLSSPPQLFIDIEFEDYQKLAYQREVGLKTGSLGDPDYVPAKATFGSESMDIKMKLKGLVGDHWVRDKKWSFRVKVKDDAAFMGMKIFSLQHPKTRDYMNEWFINQFYGDAGFVALRYGFIELIVNGESYGIYAVEEHPDKRLVENNYMREGPIFRFDTHAFSGNINLEDVFQLLPLDSYLSDKEVEDGTQQHKYYLTAEALMKSFIKGDSSADKTFDVHKLSLLFAFADLFGMDHATSLHNILFYYNPVTAKIEPIARDTQMLKALDGLISSGYGVGDSEPQNSWYASVFNDEVFYREYVAWLEIISEPSYLDDFFLRHKVEADKNMDFLYRSFPFYQFIWKPVLYENQKKIKQYLNPAKGFIATLNSDNLSEYKLKIDVESVYPLPLEISGLIVDDMLIQPKEKMLIQPIDVDNVVSIVQAIEFDLPEGLSVADVLAGDMFLNYSVLGSSFELVESIDPNPKYDSEIVILSGPKLKSDLGDFNFLYVDGENIILKGGNWVLDEPLVIPQGYTISNEGNFTLDLIDNARVISYSPFSLHSMSEVPVKFESSDGTGQGIAILETEKNDFSGVQFINLDAPSDEYWMLSGAVTLYESDVIFDSCIFEDARSEDMLNVIRADVHIKDSFFKNSFSDSFDGDFVSGMIDNTIFIDCGNDCIDFSGSGMLISDVKVQGAGDKAVSAGEKSTLDIECLSVDGAELGIASKDLSMVKADSVTFHDVNLGLLAYQKKAEFGPGKLDIGSVCMENVTTSAVIEVGSELIVGGKIYPGTEEDVAEELY